MAYQTLKYGTQVVIGLAIVGATIFQVKRIQVKAVDFIEIIEGVRERQMIVTSIGGPTTLGLQIAPNRKAIDDLTVVIDGLITNFVNQTSISNWVANYPAGGTNPPHWTKADLFTYLDIGVSGDWSRSTNAGGTLPLQVYTNHLNERYKVLQALVYTDGSTAWGSNAVCNMSDIDTLDSYSYATNFTNPSTNFYFYCSQAGQLWQDVFDNRPIEFEWSDSWYFSYPAYYCSSVSSNTGYGNAPLLTQSSTIDPYLYIIALGTAQSGLLNPPERDQLYYQVTNSFVGSYSSQNRAARIAGTARSVSIPRTDYYYLTNNLFETVSVPSNSSSSSTTGYVHAAGFDLIAEASWDYDFDSTNPAPDSATYCFGMANLMLRSGAYFSWGNKPSVTASGQTTITNLMPVIHQWGVERCIP